MIFFKSFIFRPFFLTVVLHRVPKVTCMHIPPPYLPLRWSCCVSHNSLRRKGEYVVYSCGLFNFFYRNIIDHDLHLALFFQINKNHFSL